MADEKKFHYTFKEGKEIQRGSISSTDVEAARQKLVRSNIWAVNVWEFGTDKPPDPPPVAQQQQAVGRGIRAQKPEGPPATQREMASPRLGKPPEPVAAGHTAAVAENPAPGPEESVIFVPPPPPDGAIPGQPLRLPREYEAKMMKSYAAATISNEDVKRLAPRRRRQVFICKPHNQIEGLVEEALRLNGVVTHLAMHPDLHGMLIVAIVIEHDEVEV